MTPYTNYSSEMNRMHREAILADREQIRMAKLARAESRARARDETRRKPDMSKKNNYWESLRRVFATAPPTLRYAYLLEARRG